MGIDFAELAERVCLEPALPMLPGQVERLASVLPSLLHAPLEETDRAEPLDKEGWRVHHHAETFPERLLQERAPLARRPTSANA
jgi:hypothetical protein